ncbi:hypothetical protein [uncultured Acinetobacter sp.]|uniref:hypothetical protein n=1 Tax=uncultured Acinetobacter sp. TaxID=165433 RepID=UPI00258C51FF|nr:hypothetical protein [uncultured Acinetobacter sp.]
MFAKDRINLFGGDKSIGFVVSALSKPENATSSAKTRACRKTIKSAKQAQNTAPKAQTKKVSASLM